jgi:hypothetical protein
VAPSAGNDVPMPTFICVNLITGKPPRFYEAFAPIADDVTLPECALRHIISEEQAAAERETEIEKEFARQRRAGARRAQRALSGD